MRLQLGDVEPFDVPPANRSRGPPLGFTGAPATLDGRFVRTVGHSVKLTVKTDYPPTVNHALEDHLAR